MAEALKIPPTEARVIEAVRRAHWKAVGSALARDDFDGLMADTWQGVGNPRGTEERIGDGSGS
jgi:hypothetical protein